MKCGYWLFDMQKTEEKMWVFEVQGRLKTGSIFRVEVVGNTHKSKKQSNPQKDKQTILQSFLVEPDDVKHRISEVSQFFRRENTFWGKPP